MANEKHWTEVAAKMLVGRKIVGVHYTNASEMDALGWYARALVVELDDGNVIYPSRDDEGNGPGSLFTNDAETPILPVL